MGLRNVLGSLNGAWVRREKAAAGVNALAGECNRETRWAAVALRGRRWPPLFLLLARNEL